ncbi:hypothetical protein [Bacillus chungangensis]|uniref:Uncharacterized protein n=1 Tax=Bacillus chungangensis TaxID=587633 RepID=A0ABT9WTA4_9BACI|nr:hypothetical protein [Bacillus chungangensis]MDQ0175980.1 hypothetical protein [Bacillus chungangensis]
MLKIDANLKNKATENSAALSNVNDFREPDFQVILTSYEIKDSGIQDKWNNGMNLKLSFISENFSPDKYSEFLKSFQLFLKDKGYSPFKVDQELFN